MVETEVGCAHFVRNDDPSKTTLRVITDIEKGSDWGGDIAHAPLAVLNIWIPYFHEIVLTLLEEREARIEAAHGTVKSFRRALDEIQDKLPHALEARE